MNARLYPQFISKTCCIIYKYSVKRLFSDEHCDVLMTNEVFQVLVCGRKDRTKVGLWVPEPNVKLIIQKLCQTISLSFSYYVFLFHAVCFSNESKDNVDGRRLRILACHGEDSHHAVDAPVSQQGHLHLSGCTFLLFPFGFERCPDTSPKDQ